MAKTPSTKSSDKKRKAPKIRLKYCRTFYRNKTILVSQIRRPNFKYYQFKSIPFDERGNLTVELVKEYYQFMNGEIEQQQKCIETIDRNSMNFLIQNYYKSKAFILSAPKTKSDKHSVLDRYCLNVGHLPYDKLKMEHIEASQLARADTPAAADKLVKYLKTVFNWAIEKGYVATNPAASVTFINESDGHAPWIIDELNRYRATYPIGHQARLAFELFMNTGARISDVAQFGRHNIIGDRFEFSPTKGKKHQEIISMPITPEFRAILTLVPQSNETFLLIEKGAPFSIKGLGNKMAKWCKNANIDKRSHGIRKTLAIALAEAGGTNKEFQAYFGWTDPKTIEIYTKMARSKRLIDNAALKLASIMTAESVPLSSFQNMNGTKMEKNDDKSNT